MQHWLLAMLGLITLAMAGCSSNDTQGFSSPATETGQARLRVLHATPDTPPVDVRLNGVVVASNIAYRQTTGYLNVPSGRPFIVLETTGTEKSIISTTPSLEQGQPYSLLAVGKASDSSIQPLLLQDITNAPAAGQAKLRVVQGAAGAPPLDIYLTAPSTLLPDTTPSFSRVVYQGVSSYLEIPSDTYRLRITPSGVKVPIYDSGPVALRDGAILSTIVVPTPNASAIGMVALTNDPEKPLFQLANLQATRLRMLHASPGASALDLLVDGTPIFTDMKYAQASGYLNVAPGNRNIRFRQADGQLSLINPGPLRDINPYTVVALGSAGQVEPFLLNDQTNPPATGDAKLRLIHAAPEQATEPIDVYLTAPGVDLTNELSAFASLRYRTPSPFLEVPAGEYQIRATSAGDKQVLYDSGPLTLHDGDLLTAVAITATGGTSPFELVALTNAPTNAAFTIPDVASRVRIAQLSPNAPPVDVLVNGRPVFTNLAFGGASDYAAIMPSQGPIFTIDQAGTTNTVLQTAPVLVGGKDYLMLLVNFLDQIEPLFVVQNTAEPTAGESKLQFINASPDSPSVDVLVDGKRIASDIEFEGFSDFVTMPSGSHTVEIQPGGSGTSVLTSRVVIESTGTYTLIFAGQISSPRLLTLKNN